MSIGDKRFIPGLIVEPEIDKWAAELDGLPADVAVHCSAALLGQLMDHAVRYRHTEVFGLLLGRALRTPALKTRTLVLDFLAAERFASSSVSFVEVSAQELIRLDQVHEASPEKKNLRKVGWFHTHPGHGIFMSSTDRSNHSMYSNPWQVALVLDPIHRTWGFFAGPECKPIPAVTEGDHASFVIPVSTEGHMENNPAEKGRSATWLVSLVAILLVAQTFTVVGGARALRRVAELRTLVIKQQDRLASLERRVEALSSSLRQVERSGGQSSRAADPIVKKK
jgi:proteasome lid subunit RPN8/RPN11